MTKVTFYGPRARDWLREYLRNGPIDCEIVKAVARVEGFTKGELNRAKTLLRVKITTTPQGIRLWQLP